MHILLQRIAALFLLLCTGIPIGTGLSWAENHDAPPAKIDLLIGSKPGGGYDRYGRLVAKHLENQLDGSHVAPLNKAKAGGVPGLEEVAKKGADGSKIMIFNTGLLLSQLAGKPLKLDEYGWIGKASSEARVLLISTNTNIHSFEDLRAHGEGLIFVTSGHGKSGYIQTNLLNDAFDLKLKVVPGFGGNEAEAALIKGEAAGALVSESNVPALLETGSVKPILVFGKVKFESIAMLTQGNDIAKTKDERLVANTITNMSELGRAFVAAPELSKEKLETFRQAFDAALNDPEFLSEAATQNMPIAHLDGAQTEKLALEILKADDRLAEMVRATLEK